MNMTNKANNKNVQIMPLLDCNLGLQHFLIENSDCTQINAQIRSDIENLNNRLHNKVLRETGWERR